MSYEPGASYSNFIQWLQTKARGVNEISPAIAGAYLALAGELSTLRAEAIAAHDELAKKAESAPPHDTESA